MPPLVENIIWTIFIGLPLAVGWAAMSSNPPDLNITRGCFIITALILLARISWGLVFEHQFKNNYLLIISFASTFLLVSLILGWGLLWINNRELMAKKIEAEKVGNVVTWQATIPESIEKEFPIKLISGQIEDGVINPVIGRDKFPIITDDASTVFSRTKLTKNYAHDLFFYLFLKWMNSNFHQGWSLIVNEPIIDKSSWHEPLFDSSVDNSNILKFHHLPLTIRNNNIFFSNPELFKSDKFKFVPHTKFPIEEFAIALPPETKISFVDDSHGTMIILDNNYCNVIFQLTACSASPGLPLEMIDLNKGFSEKEFYKYYTLNWNVLFQARFKDTKNFDEQKKYVKWAKSLINYYQCYFDWSKFTVKP